MAPLIWLVTGSTSGIGEATVSEIINRGDLVVAAGRRVEERLGHMKSPSLRLLELDVAASAAEIGERIRQGWEAFGHIDVLFNNAGISALKCAEEADDVLVNNLFQVNVFGQMHVTNAILPFFRKRGHGYIAFTSSGSAWIALPFMSHYAASKAALSTYVEALHKEVRPLGIRCVAIECGAFGGTNLGQPRDQSQAGFGSAGPAIQDYTPLFGRVVGKMMADLPAHVIGDTSKAAARIVDFVKQEGLAAGKPWAVRVALGTDGMEYAKQRCEEQLELVKTWAEFSCSTDKDGREPVAAREMFEFTTVLEK